MGAVTLPYNPIDRENTIKEAIMTTDGRLAPSIRLEAPDSHYLAESLLILNDEKHVEQVKDPTIRKENLQLHGIPVSSGGTIIKEYLLAVFQTNVLAIYRTTNGAWLVSPKRQNRNSFQRVSLQEKSKEVKRVQTLAIRALYALGLDYGVIRCGIGAGRKTEVIQVIPSPRLTKDLEAAFVRSIVQYKEQIEAEKIPLEQIVLGADPEFVMQSPKGDLLIASKYFPVQGKVGCDAIWFGQNHSHKPLVEIRPNPTPDPRQLVVQIYQSLLFAAKKMKNTPTKWLAGAMPYNGFPLGGHIHFSGIQPNFKMLRALDNYLSLLLIMVEDTKGKGRRPKYGFLGDFRFKPHGGFEYRTPPSWLVSPTLTKGIFVLAKLIVANYPSLSLNPLADSSIQQAFYEGDKDLIRSRIECLWDDLKKLEDYESSQTYLVDFYNYITSGVTWDETQDFRKNWRIPPYNMRKQA